MESNRFSIDGEAVFRYGLTQFLGEHMDPSSRLGWTDVVRAGSAVTSLFGALLFASVASCLCGSLFAAWLDDEDEGAACNPDGLTDDEAGFDARHEAGHAIVARDLRPEWFQQVDLYPMGISLEEDHCATGITMLDLPGTMTRDELHDRIAIAYGGYAADIQYRLQPVTGSGRDIEMATLIAIASIDEYGIGLVVMPYNHRLLRDRHVVLSPELEALRSVEIRSLLDESLVLATEIVRSSEARIEIVAGALLDAPGLTLTREDVDQLFAADAGPLSAETPHSYE